MSGEEISREMEAIIGELQHLLELVLHARTVQPSGKALSKENPYWSTPGDKRAAIKKWQTITG